MILGASASGPDIAAFGGLNAPLSPGKGVQMEAAERKPLWAPSPEAESSTERLTGQHALPLSKNQKLSADWMSFLLGRKKR